LLAIEKTKSLFEAPILLETLIDVAIDKKVQEIKKSVDSLEYFVKLGV
jgi:hypothetical protein